MKFDLDRGGMPQTSGYGMFPENARFRLFKPAIAFNADNGARDGGSGSGETPPEPSNTNGGTNEDVSGLKNALEAERRRAKEFEKQFKQLQESVKGIDPEKYKQFEDLQRQAEEWNQREIKIRNEVEGEWTPKVQAESEKAKGFESKYLNLVLKTEAEKAFQAAKGRIGASELGITFFDSFLAIVNKSLRLNDKGVVEVVDNNGTRLFSKKDSTKPMSPVEYFEALRNDPVLGYCFEPVGNGKGGGMQQSNGFGSTQQDISSLPRTERLTIARQQAAGR